MFLDLDRFKHINDSLGHAVGDQLLQQFAQRLRQTLRADDTIARISGDEFVVLLEDIVESTTVIPIAHKLMAVLKQPFIIHDHQVRVSVSIGISLCPDDGCDAATLCAMPMRPCIAPKKREAIAIGSIRPR